MTRRQGMDGVVWLGIFVISGCAPVKPPTPTDAGATPTASAAAPAEQLDIMPKRRSSGPQARILAAIDHVRDRELLTTNGFWTVFHGILGLGPKSTMLRDPETGRRVNAFDYIAGGGELRGLRFIPTSHGLDVQMGPFAVGQGHQDQFVAEMAQWGMMADQKFVVLGKEYTFRDFIRHTQMRASVTEKQELSWAIVIVGQYLGTDAAWTNAAGQQLHLKDLVRYELDADVEHAPCGGTHRLFGLTWVYQLQQHNGDVGTGIWQEVAAKTAKYRDRARQYQNSDGSFSTEFFRGPGNAADPQLRINATGHILEWLALALSDEAVRQPWVENAAAALAIQILDLRDAPIEGGSLYHAVHGLSLYAARVYGPELMGPNRPFFPSDSRGTADPAKRD